MTSCAHQLCGKENRMWLPTTDRYSAVEQHGYCTVCGVIQNRSEDRPKALGYWMNQLGVLGVKLGLSQCQRRLIAKELECQSYMQDTFGSFGSGQKALFQRIVSRYCDVSSVDLESIL